MKADGIANVPHYEDRDFWRFAERHGYDWMSPAVVRGSMRCMPRMRLAPLRLMRR
jgi:hypothetical protein